jgi:hypothetical protein
LGLNKGKWITRPVIENEQIGLAQRPDQLMIRAIKLGDFHLLLEECFAKRTWGGGSSE